MSKHWHYAEDAEHIGRLTLDMQDKSANVLSHEVLSELETVIECIESAPPRGLLLLSGKAKGFIAGADVNEFLEIASQDEAERHIHWVHDLFQRVEDLTCPSAALIHGFCVGGGLELALACRYRIASDASVTRLGFPEIRLGLFPGYGGTVRSIRRSGVLQAMPLMLSGRSLAAIQARRMGLVDWVVPQRQLSDAGRKILQEQPKQRSPGLSQVFANNFLLRPILARHMRRAAELHANLSHYPAPGALIEHWRRHGSEQDALYGSEARNVSRLLCTDTARNLIRVFRLQERLKGLGRSADFTLTRVHVVGGGVMGGDIAAWCALRGLHVSLQDMAPERLTQAIRRANALFTRKLREPRLVQAAADRLTADYKGAGAGRADVIIEAIFENLEAKQALFRELETKASPQALLATNTSSIPLDELAQGLRNPERLIGLHFFNPVARMQLVEVVHDRGTDPGRVAQGQALVRRIDRLPLPVRSAPGFLVNRVLMPYLLEAVDLLEEAVPAAAVDQAARGFGMPVGPVELADAVGLDICLAVAGELTGRTATPTEAPVRLQRMVEAGRLGKKTGEGFYGWRDGHAEIPRIPSDYRIPDDLADRLIFRLLNEAVACLREGIVEDPDLLDAGVIFGTGFAPFRGGPMRYIEHGGLERMRRRMERLHDTHGEHFMPDSGWGQLGHT